MADERFLAMFDSGDLSNLRCETNIASALLNAPEVLFHDASHATTRVLADCTRLAYEAGLSPSSKFSGVERLRAGARSKDEWPHARGRFVCL